MKSKRNRKPDTTSADDVDRSFVAGVQRLPQEQFDYIMETWLAQEAKLRRNGYPAEADKQAAMVATWREARVAVVA